MEQREKREQVTETGQEEIAAKERAALLKERYELAKERLEEIAGGQMDPDWPAAGRDEADGNALPLYFQQTAAFLLLTARTFEWIAAGGFERGESLEELSRRNRALYADILPVAYESSFAEPAYAARELGAYGPVLSALYAELYSLIAYAHEQDLENMVIRMELFLEVYHAFSFAQQPGETAPGPEELKDMLYWFAGDYAEDFLCRRFSRQFGLGPDPALRIVTESDLTDLRYLYRYGEYITEKELRMAKHLNALPQETIDLMADTFTEGYRKGFLMTGKDLSQKRTVELRYPLGFERMVKRAVENFQRMGLASALMPAPVSFLEGRSVYKNGYAGSSPNKQFDYDHQDDKGLFYDKKYKNRRLDGYRNALERCRKAAAVYGGPAVIEGFGEQPFTPVSKPERSSYDREQQALLSEFSARAGAVLNEYVKGEERSFTIIAFPVPEIGPQFEAIFDEVLRINTLDYETYQRIQQVLIDILDTAAYVEVKGAEGNRTDLRVALHRLADPAKETNFENCVADVNIPVGEVFTSPRLAGTNGLLHVKEVYLNGLKYQDLWVKLEEGMTADYGCANFEDRAEGKKLMREQILHYHDTLPLGEFAIGTNTTAYRAAKRYDMAGKLPILIAEKMGPHFALGDTCYSHEEDLTTYNPDGKAITARENEISALRREDETKAYFGCHTDITIPYEELGEVTAVSADGVRREIIRDGHFVPAACGELNRALLEN